MGISVALQKDVKEVLNLTSACGKLMRENGIYQWSETYPDKAVIAKDIEREEMFCLCGQDGIIGVITLNEQADEEYDQLEWGSSGSYLVVHRLAVHPEYQGQGFAQQLMDFAEEKAKREGYSHFRLDTYTLNPCKAHLLPCCKQNFPWNSSFHNRFILGCW